MKALGTVWGAQGAPGPTCIRASRTKGKPTSVPTAASTRLAPFHSLRVGGAGGELVWGDFCQGGATRVLSTFSSLSFFVRPGKPFLRPDPHVDGPARAGAVKAGRILAATEGLALDGAEHAGTLGRVGMTKSEGSPRVVHEGSCHILVFGGREAQTMMQ
jgi:hypothetical protein